MRAIPIMRKILYLIFILNLYMPPSILRAEHELGTDSAVVATSEEQLKSVNLLLARVKEIKSMNMSDMSVAEKQELRQELNSIKHELKAQKKSAINGPIKALVWIIVGAALGIIAAVLFLLGAFN